MKKGFIVLIILVILSAGSLTFYLYYTGINNQVTNADDNSNLKNDELILINHNHAHLEDFINIPDEWISSAKENLSIVYWHTSHGSQLITGMIELDDFMDDNDVYEFNSDGSEGNLHLYDNAGSHLTGNTNGFDDQTRSFLDSHPEYNVVIWSWCGLDKNSASINEYLNNMNQLESEFPNVRFVYMTAHLEGTGEEGDLHIYNEMIRDYCLENNKTLYDFADIESYNPDDEYFLDKYANDNCDYDSDVNGDLDANWALEWENSHEGTLSYSKGGKWYECSAAHSQALNGNLKAYGAWYLFARLAGWNGS